MCGSPYRATATGLAESIRLLKIRSSRHIPLRSLAVTAARVTADRHGQMLAGGYDGRRPEPVVRRSGHLSAGRAGPGLAAHSIAFSFRCDSHRFTGCRCGLLGRRDGWLEPTGSAPALKGVAGGAVAAARRRSRFPADWRSARGGWPARWMPRWSREPTASPDRLGVIWAGA